MNHAVRPYSAGIIKRIVASLSGRAVQALSSLAALPLVVWLLGAEAVGLLGFFITLQVVVTVCEGGLTSALVRDLSRLTHSNGRRSQYLSRLYINTYLATFCVIGVVAGTLIWIFSGYLGSEWLRSDAIPSAEIESSIKWMGVFIALNFPALILQAVLIGRERQVKLNCVLIPFSLARNLGVLGLQIVLGAPYRIEEFFMYQALVQGGYALALLAMVRRESRIPFIRTPAALSVLRRSARFSSQIFLITLTSVAILQADKLYLSGAVPLEAYAGYSTACAIANAPYVLSSALYAVIFPRFSAYLASTNLAAVASVYRAAFVVLSVPLVIIAACVYLFPEPLLRMVFPEPLASEIGTLLPVLMCGSVIQSLLSVPYSLQLASGWTSFALRLNLVLVPIAVVSIPLLFERYGMEGVAWGWLIYNVATFAVTVFVVARRFGTLGRAMVHSLIPSVVATAGLLPILWLFKQFSEGMDDIEVVAVVGILWGGSVTLMFWGTRSFWRFPAMIDSHGKTRIDEVI